MGFYCTLTFRLDWNPIIWNVRNCVRLFFGCISWHVCGDQMDVVVVAAAVVVVVVLLLLFLSEQSLFDRLHFRPGYHLVFYDIFTFLLFQHLRFLLFVVAVVVVVKVVAVAHVEFATSNLPSFYSGCNAFLLKEVEMRLFNLLIFV